MLVQNYKCRSQILCTWSGIVLTFAILYFAQEQTTWRKIAFAKPVAYRMICFDRTTRSHVGPFYRLKNGEKSEVVKLKQRRANAAVKNLPRRRVAKMLAKILWSIGRRTRTKVYRRWRFGQSGKCMKAPARSPALRIRLAGPPSLLRPPPSSPLHPVQPRPPLPRYGVRGEPSGTPRRPPPVHCSPASENSGMSLTPITEKCDKGEFYSLPPLKNSQFVSALPHECHACRVASKFSS